MYIDNCNANAQAHVQIYENVNARCPVQTAKRNLRCRIYITDTQTQALPYTLFQTQCAHRNTMQPPEQALHPEARPLSHSTHAPPRSRADRRCAALCCVRAQKPAGKNRQVHPSRVHGTTHVRDVRPRPRGRGPGGRVHIGEVPGRCISRALFPTEHQRIPSRRTD